MGKFGKFIVGILILGLLFGIFLSIDIISFGKRKPDKKADSIMVLGCRVYGTTPSPFLIGRLNEGIRLLNEGYGEYIIVTGGTGPGEDISEAEAMKTYLISKGIDESKIITEDKSTSTMENLSFSLSKMKEKNISSTIIVSNKYHLRRAFHMAKKVGIDAQYSGVFINEYKLKEVKGFLREILALGKFYVFDM